MFGVRKLATSSGIRVGELKKGKSYKRDFGDVPPLSVAGLSGVRG